MPDERSSSDIEKLLADEKALGDRKQELIAALLKQREAAINDFDERLAKLGYDASGGKRKRSHHKKPAPEVIETPKPKSPASR